MEVNIAIPFSKYIHMRDKLPIYPPIIKTTSYANSVLRNKLNNQPLIKFGIDIGRTDKYLFHKINQHLVTISKYLYLKITKLAIIIYRKIKGSWC